MIDERPDELRHVVRIERVVRDGRGRRHERESSAEQGQPTKSRLLITGEQPVAPIEEGGDASLSLRQVAVPAAQEAETIIEPVEYLARVENTDSRGRDLEGERQAVESFADRRDGCGRVVIKSELGAGGFARGSTNN